MFFFQNGMHLKQNIWESNSQIINLKNWPQKSGFSIKTEDDSCVFMSY